MEAENKVVRKTVLVPCAIRNPAKVENGQGRVIGAANLKFVSGAGDATSDYLAVEFFLDKQNPEVFDLLQEPARCQVGVDGRIDSEGLEAVVVLVSR